MVEQTLPIWEYKIKLYSPRSVEVGSYLYYTIIRKVKQLFPLTAEKVTRRFRQFERRAAKRRGAKRGKKFKI